ncbi:MAG: sodium:calcium antiporter [Flavobacteriaceae bacterium]
MMLDFVQLGLPVNLVLFPAAAAVVWFAGTRLTHYADAISNATGIGQAVVGIILLAGVTSLPEIGATATAAVAGDAQLAVNNLFGSIALQVALLAVVDAVIGRRALTSVVPEPTIFVQGGLNIVLISLAAAAFVSGDIGLFGIGLWSWGFLLAYVCCVWILSSAQGRTPWLAASGNRVDRGLIDRQRRKSGAGGQHEALRSLAFKTAGVAALILVAGFVLARSADAIAQQTGIGSSFVGYVLLAFATSLPELSSALAAARRGLFTMAISDIYGTNLINVALIFLVDLLDTGDPVANRMDSFAIFGALLAIVLTAIFMIGLAERRDRSFARMGYDSILVAIAYLGGVAILYTLRQG